MRGLNGLLIAVTRMLPRVLGYQIIMVARPS
jgi:hypothetical protein